MEVKGGKQMIVGIMSDSHDRLEAIEAAVDKFNDLGAGFVIHAGDIVAPFALTPLSGLKCVWAGVFGNNDGEKNGLSKRSDGRIKDGPLKLEIDGRLITVVHDIESCRQNASCLESEILIHGHSHNHSVKRENGRLVINPGETCGYLTGSMTVAILDTKQMTVKIEKLLPGTGKKL